MGGVKQFFPEQPPASLPEDAREYLDRMFRNINESLISILDPGGLYNDNVVSGFATGLGASAPTLTNFRGNIDLFAFAGSGPTEELFIAFHLLHDIMPGEDATLHIHWSHIIAAPSGNVKWQVEYSAAQGYEQEAFPTVTTDSTTVAAGTQYHHHITPDDITIPAALMIPDSILLVRVFRDSSDAADTFANDAYFITADLHYKRDRFGTVERNAPFEDY